QSLTAHSAFYLLRSSISTPRLIYFLRCAPSWRRSEDLQDYDGALRSALETILNCDLGEEGWLQSSLPVKLGGLGIRHALDVALPCFLASAHSVGPLVDALLPCRLRGFDPALIEACEWWEGFGTRILPAPEERGIQAKWEQPFVESIIHHLHSSATTLEDKARLLALQQPDTSNWLNVLPSPPLGT